MPGTKPAAGGTIQPAPPQRRLTPAGGLAAARSSFVNGNRVDMQALAAELGIGRTTLYRWFGDRDALLAEVLWELSETTLNAAYEDVSGKGCERVIRALEEFMGRCVAFPPLRKFLSDEPECAIRVLLSPPLANRLRGWTADALRTRTPVADGDTERLADAITQIGLVYCWANIVAGTDPDIGRAVQAIRVVLSS